VGDVMAKKWQPPKSAQTQAKRVLELRKELPPSKRAMTPTGVKRAQQFASGQAMTLETAKRVAQFARHIPEADKAKAAGKSAKDSKAIQAVMGWGGKAAIKSAKAFVKQQGKKKK